MYHVNEEDYPLNSATVHDTSTCSHAQIRKKKTEDGQWHGPFDTFEEARRRARQTGRVNVKNCSDCIK